MCEHTGEACTPLTPSLFFPFTPELVYMSFLTKRRKSCQMLRQERMTYRTWRTPHAQRPKTQHITRTQHSTHTAHTTPHSVYTCTDTKNDINTDIDTTPTLLSVCLSICLSPCLWCFGFCLSASVFLSCPVLSCPVLSLSVCLCHCTSADWKRRCLQVSSM